MLKMKKYRFYAHGKGWGAEDTVFARTKRGARKKARSMVRAEMGRSAPKRVNITFVGERGRPRYRRRRRSGGFFGNLFG